jgi:hypothetical protein
MFLKNIFSSAWEILEMFAGGKINLFYDARILTEYKEVLSRPQFAFSRLRTLYPDGGGVFEKVSVRGCYAGSEFISWISCRYFRHIQEYGHS